MNPGFPDPRELLALHAPLLVEAARAVLTRDPTARVAGVILTPGCAAPASLRVVLHEITTGPTGITTGIVARRHVEPLLQHGPDADYWMEQGWQPQTVLPIGLFVGATCEFAFFTIRGGVRSPHER